MSGQTQPQPQQTQTREEWLNTAAELICATVESMPFSLDYIRIAPGFARGRQRSPVMVTPKGESSASRVEIFIDPTEDRTPVVLRLLTYGLARARRNGRELTGHERETIGLIASTEPHSAPLAKDTLAEKLDMIETALGEPYPHAALAKRHKEPTRSRLMHCTECGMNWRVSQSLVPRQRCCPACIGTNLQTGTKLSELVSHVHDPSQS